MTEKATVPGVYMVLVPVDAEISATTLARLARATVGTGGRLVTVLRMDWAGPFDAQLAARRREILATGLALGTADTQQHYHRVLANELLLDDPEVVEASVTFVVGTSMDIGHGRTRARMCRRLKRSTLTGDQITRLVSTTCTRLTEGRFGQQFRDHLHLALSLDPTATQAAARRCAADPRRYVRRMATWVLTRPGSSAAVPSGLRGQ